MGVEHCPIFQGIPPQVVASMLEGHHSVKRYRPGELVALQGSRYETLLIVSEGKVRGEMTDSLGRTTLIEEIPAPRVVAPAFLFATENRLPVSILASEETEVVAIQRSSFTEMMQQEGTLLTNFLRSMSDRSRFLSDKLQMQRFGTIRSKLARYLLEVASIESSTSGFVIPHTQQQLADRFGVTRPALARGLAQLEAEGLIHYKRNFCQIVDLGRLRRL
jgi:CRP/FNR family transcriptional regulator, dissimilatory nitrate respiration regulator